MIIKNPNSKQNYLWNEDIFEDCTFYIQPKVSYQIFITRTYIKDLNTLYAYLMRQICV